MTAVEFTIEKYEKFINSENGSGERYFYDELVKDIEQAKAMEKEQIVNAHLFGLLRPLEMEATKQAEQYYNETYGS
jgi:molybdate-binding protein